MTRESLYLRVGVLTHGNFHSEGSHGLSKRVKRKIPGDSPCERDCSLFSALFAVNRYPSCISNLSLLDFYISFQAPIIKDLNLFC